MTSKHLRLTPNQIARARVIDNNSKKSKVRRKRPMISRDAMKKDKNVRTREEKTIGRDRRTTNREEIRMERSKSIRCRLQRSKPNLVKTLSKEKRNQVTSKRPKRINRLERRLKSLKLKSALKVSLMKSRKRVTKTEGWKLAECQ